MSDPSYVERYARHIMLREIGGPGQKRLAEARVLIVGAGGLGGPAALYLAAAGVGLLRLVDDDHVSLSNLQRQVLFASADVGRPKVEAGLERLAALNPHIRLEGLAQRFDAHSAGDLLRDIDVVLDGCDDFATRFVVNEACHRAARPLVSGAIGRWEAQVGVFASGCTKGRPTTERNPCYQCFVPAAPPQAPTCAAVGVVGALAGLAGSLMALEAVKLITAAGDPLIGRLAIIDGLSGEARTVRLAPDPDCPVCGGAPG